MGTPARVLILLDNCGKGDAFRVLPLLEAIRRGFPSAAIALLVGEGAAPVLEGTSVADRTVVSRLYRHRSRAGRWLQLKKALTLLNVLRRIGLGYDLVITFYWGTALLQVLGRLVGRGERIGFAGRLPQLLTIDLGPFDLEADQVRQNAELVRRAGIDPSIIDAVPRSSPTANGHPPMPLAAGLAGPRGFALLHPGSHWACQQWSAARWAELADSLAVDYDLDVVFSGSSDERGLVDETRSLMRQRSTSLAGQTSFRDLAGVVGAAQLVICVDSVVFELAQAAQRPTVVLAGATIPATDPRLRGVLVVDRTPLSLRRAMIASKRAHGADGGCLNYACPMSQLRDIEVGHVRTALEQLVRPRVASGRV